MNDSERALLIAVSRCVNRQLERRFRESFGREGEQEWVELGRALDAVTSADDGTQE